MPRAKATTTDTHADALADVLRAVEDDACRRWLEALLTRGESAGGGTEEVQTPRTT